MPLLSIATRVITKSTRCSSAIYTRPLSNTISSSFQIGNQFSRNVTSTTSSQANVLKKSFHSSAPAYEEPGSHSDFAPKRKSVDGDDVHAMIHEHVTNNKIMVYMKGTPNQPQCGFSGKVVQMLQVEGVDFSSVNVLDYPQIRDGIKKYSDWPTIPQLYVDGEFIGGCDIITSMHESGELGDIVKKKEE